MSAPSAGTEPRLDEGTARPGWRADAAPEELLALARDVAYAAGALIVRRRAEGLPASDTKSTPTDVVTASDRESEELIRGSLLRARPDDSVLGEEDGPVEGTSEVSWIVDPIDGTVNYYYDIPLYTVSIAAAYRGEVVAGVVHNPVTAETWTATRGGGAYLNRRLIRVSGQRDLSQALVGTGFGYSARKRAEQIAVLSHVITKVRDIRRTGCASLELCHVAMGRGDASFESGLKLWDYAAGLLIAEEAGARVGGMRGARAGEALTITASPALFDPLHRLLADAGL